MAENRFKSSGYESVSKPHWKLSLAVYSLSYDNYTLLEIDIQLKIYTPIKQRYFDKKKQGFLSTLWQLIKVMPADILFFCYLLLKLIQFPVWLRNRLISGGLETVFQQY